VAQVPTVSPPAFLTTDHSASWEPGQLLYRQVGLGRTTVISYHNGVLYAGGYAGGPYDAFEWSDWSDASSLSLTNAVGTPEYENVPIATTQGTHGHSGKVGDYLMNGVMRTSTPGVNTFATSPDRIRSGDRPRPEGAGGAHSLYFPWMLPFEWPQYGDATGLGWVYRHTDLLGTWDAGGESGVFGHTLMVGNLLIICSDETDSGVAVYDMGPLFQDPPQPPQLLDKLDGIIGGYLPAIWRNYIIFPTDGELQLVDYQDPTNLSYVGAIPVPSAPGQQYVQFQDEYAFFQASKINMETGEVELTLDFDDAGNRPAGSVAGKLNTSQYLMPMGNLLVTGGRGTTGEDGVGLWVHQDEPDTTRPFVAYHVPRPNQTQYPVGAPISLLVHDSLEGFTIVNGESVIVREAGTSTPIDCWVSFSHDDVLTITPKNYLSENTEYEVEIVDNGIRDVAGNGIVGLQFNFSTGATANGNQPPVIQSLTVDASPTQPGAPVNFNVSANDPEGTATLEYRINYGDGTPVSDWTVNATSYNHTYLQEGHYEAKIQVREVGNPAFLATEIFVVSVVEPVSGPQPTKSSPIALDAVNDRVWVVNPDNDSVTKINRTTEVVEAEYGLGGKLGIGGPIDPRSIAVDGSGNVWVVCRSADLLAILNGSNGNLIVAVDLGYGSAPVGVAISSDGADAFVTTEGRGHEAAAGAGNAGDGQVIRFDATSYSNGVAPTETGSLALGPMPRAIAVFGEGDRLLVTRFISGHPAGGEVWDVDASAAGALSLRGTIYLPIDVSTVGGNSSQADASNGAGVPNYVSSITISPDQEWAWYTATKPDVGRGNLFGTELDFDNTVRAMIGRIDLRPSEPIDDDASRIDFDNADSPTAVAFSPFGDWAFVTAQGNNFFGVFDRLDILQSGTVSSRNSRARVATGLAPQGVILDAASQKLWVKNFMDRSVTIHDLASFLTRGSLSGSPAVVETVQTEALTASVLNGKQIFYNASDTGGLSGLNRMSDEGYISCATCHVDGMHDGLTWDFTQRGEGLRNTIDLRGRGGMAHGNVHWTANFDEIQDFENDMRIHFGGQGFLSQADFDATADPLGASKSGLNGDLDDLAAYVSSLGAVSLPKSPHRDFTGGLSALAEQGAAVFGAQNCGSCHSATSQYTDSAGGDGLGSLHDVGTLRATSGSRLGGALPGIDTPTLLGIWNSAPYLHDGSAGTIEEVFHVAGGTLYQAEDGSLLGGADIRNLNQANSVSGAQGGLAARVNSSGKGVEWQVDGGSGGTARLEIRAAAKEATTFEVVVNGGTPIPVALPATQQDGLDAAHWINLPVEVSLTSGSGNSIRVVNASGGGSWIDFLHVATSDDLAAADVHTRVSGISAQDREALLAYLVELDGASVDLPPDTVTDWAARWTFDDTDAENSGSNLTLDRRDDAAFSDADPVLGSHALILDGVDDWVSIQNAGESFLTAAFVDRSFSLWFKPDGLSGQQMLFEEGGASRGIAVRLNGSTLEAAVRHSGETSQVNASVGGVVAGVWQHAVVVFDGDASTLSVYLNAGTPGIVATPSSSIGNHSSGPSIGQSGQNAFGSTTPDYFAGQIDDLRVYGRVLTAADALAIFDGGGGVPNTTPSIGATVLADAREGESYLQSLSATGGEAPLSWSMSGAPGWLSLDPVSGELSGTPGFGAAGAFTFTVLVEDTDGDQDQVDLDLTVLPGSGGSPNLAVVGWQGTQALSPEDGWLTSGKLGAAYTNPVIIATIAQTPGVPPAVPMIRPISGVSDEFEIRIAQAADAGTPDPSADYDVTVLVVEAGVYDGWEAGTFDSTITDHNGSWQGERLAFAQSYTNPVVFGQVMLNEGVDADWSVFWSAEDNGGVVRRTNPASGSSAFIGKHVGEDADITRPNATLGYLIAEAGALTIEGKRAFAALSSDTPGVEEIDEATGPAAFDVSASGFEAIATAIAGTVEMDGGDGGWSVLVNPGPIAGSTVVMAFQEDDMGDTDNNHTSETVGLLVIEGGVPNGAITRDYWTGIDGNGVGLLTGDTRYPSSPTGSDTLSRLEAVDWNDPTDSDTWADDYGQRIHGYLHAPATGSYTFWISGDDHCELWLSTDDSPQNRVRIAEVNGWTHHRVWNKYAGQKSATIDLVAGERYFLEVLHKENGGGDRVAVAWRKPGDASDPVNGDAGQIVPGSVLETR